MLDFGFYLMDCMEGMAQFPDKYFDLAIVDTEYNIQVNHNMGRRKGDKKSNYKPAKWDNKRPKKKYFNELYRISKNQIIWGANHLVDLICKKSSCWIVWDKKFSNDVSFASCELAYTSFDSVVKKFTYSSARQNGIHPTQKPVALYRWLLQNYAKPNDKILDTHVGSASSLIACEMEGFQYVGFEIDKDYYDAAQKRLKQFRKQLTLNI